MNISNRLKTIASLIPSNAIILDVGCDHALLDIYLALNNPNMKIYAQDIKAKPLKFAKENIKKYNLENKITLYQSDGLNNMPQDVNTLVLAGMGSNTIINILKKEKLSKIETIITASNNDYELLRRHLCNLNYHITDEEVIKENKKYYIIIKVNKKRKHYTKKDYKYGPILRKKQDNNTIDYYNYLLKKKENILKMLPTSKLKQRLKLKKEIRYLKKII